MTEILLNPLLVTIASAALAVLFAHAALVKLGDVALLEHHLAGYSVPASLRAGAGKALIALEGVTALALLSPWRAWGAVSAVVLLWVYALAMAMQLWLKRSIDCGCGAQALPVSLALVWRNALLSLLGGLAMQTVPAQPWTVFDFAVVCAALVLSVVLYTAIHQVLFHQSLLRQRSF